MRRGLLLSTVFLALHDGQSVAQQHPPPQTQVAGLQAAIEKLEYQPTERQGRLSAPNRAQGLRLVFTEGGMSVETRAGGQPLVSLGLTTFGRHGSMRALGTAPVRAAGGGTVERSWDGIVEWFLNVPRGVEHGWTVSEKPTGEGPVVLSVAVSAATAAVSDSEVRFESDSGQVLHYGSLKALDALGTELPARMVATSTGLRIEVDDTAARYPLVIDPLLTASVDG
jgi:hypothetical protein